MSRSNQHVSLSRAGGEAVAAGGVSEEVGGGEARSARVAGRTVAAAARAVAVGAAVIPSVLVLAAQTRSPAGAIARYKKVAVDAGGTVGRIGGVVVGAGRTAQGAWTERTLVKTGVRVEAFRTQWHADFEQQKATAAARAVFSVTSIAVLTTSVTRIADLVSVVRVVTIGTSAAAAAVRLLVSAVTAEHASVVYLDLVSQAGVAAD